MKFIRLVVAVFSVVALASVISGCGNKCASAREQAVACQAELCADDENAHSHCGDEIPEIAECSGSAQGAASRALEESDCGRTLNLYMTAAALSGD